MEELLVGVPMMHHAPADQLPQDRSDLGEVLGEVVGGSSRDGYLLGEVVEEVVGEVGVAGSAP